MAVRASLFLPGERIHPRDEETGAFLANAEVRLIAFGRAKAGPYRNILALVLHSVSGKKGWETTYEALTCG